MPVLKLRLSSFKFKRGSRDWEGPIEVDLSNNGCVALTGINAGGKTLTLKALDSFTSLLCDPSDKKLADFLSLVQITDIESISAEYEFVWPFFYDGDGQDGSTALDLGEEDPTSGSSWEVRGNVADIHSSAPRSQLPKSDEGYVLEEWEVYEPKISIETTFERNRGFFRRKRCTVSGELEFAHKLRAKGDPTTHTVEFREMITQKRAKRVFVSKSELKNFGAKSFRDYLRGGFYKDVSSFSRDIERFRMSQYGLNGFENELESRVGLSAYGDWDEYDPFDDDKRFIFSPVGTKLLIVDDAYVMDRGTRGLLSGFNEELRHKVRGRRFINRRLKQAYDRAVQFHAKKAHMSADVFQDQQMLLYLTRQRPSEMLKSAASRAYLAEILMLCKTIHPRRFENITTNIWNFEEWPEWVFASDIPTVSFTPPEHDDPFQFESSRNGQLQKVLHYYNDLLEKFDPDFHYWLVLNQFMDFPTVLSDYYSSGQRRIISIMSSVKATDDGTVILIDEPELSLHIDWQRSFIESMEKFNRAVVLSTHSPDIVYHHTEKVIEVPPRKEV